ncbi:Amidohydrolase [Verrucomicrobia bacterium]|nr:Amidohydrolase [Verrucomicrobiota bacterium]
MKNPFAILLPCLCALTGNQAKAQALLLTGATVHTVTGETWTPGQVLVRDGKIAAVGKSVPVEGAQRIELSGQQLYPGLIALNTVLGLMEIEAVRATLDMTEVGDYSPDVESWVAVNPDSELIPVTRANGIAYFQPVPTGGIISGQSGLVAVEGWTTEQRTAKAPVALDVFWPAMELEVTPRRPGPGKKTKSLEEQAKERRAKLSATEDFFDEAKAYARAKDAAAKGTAPAPERIPAWEAMLPYVRGELPIMIHADEVRQIRAAVEWAATNNYKILLSGGRDAWMAAGLLASNKVPVIYGHTFTRPTRENESYDVHFRAPELLRQAGVRVAFCLGPAGFEAPLTRNLPYAAAQAVAFGLPADEALKGLTLYPAQFVGAADRLGSIDVGKEATLVAVDGDMLDLRANVKRMWVAGKEIDLASRHTRLYQKYEGRPKY